MSLSSVPIRISLSISNVFSICSDKCKVFLRHDDIVNNQCGRDGGGFAPQLDDGALSRSAFSCLSSCSSCRRWVGLRLAFASASVRSTSRSRASTLTRRSLSPLAADVEIDLAGGAVGGARGCGLGAPAGGTGGSRRAARRSSICRISRDSYCARICSMLTSSITSESRSSTATPSGFFGGRSGNGLAAAA